MCGFDAVGDDYTLHVARTALTEMPVGGTTDPKRATGSGATCCSSSSPASTCRCRRSRPTCASCRTRSSRRSRSSSEGRRRQLLRAQRRDQRRRPVPAAFLRRRRRRLLRALAAGRRQLRVRDVIARCAARAQAVMPDAVRRDGAADARQARRRRRLRSRRRVQQAGRRTSARSRPATSPHPTGDIYRDLCDSQAGVCRHRSFAFMVTANALGIPTRYVQNEAHAFVEVWFPDRGWQRIDLGGAALRMDVTGADNKTLHRPRADDPFHKPPEYKNQYTQLEGDIKGLTDQQMADKKKVARSVAAERRGRSAAATAAAAERQRRRRARSHHARSDAAAGDAGSEEANARAARHARRYERVPRRLHPRRGPRRVAGKGLADHRGRRVPRARRPRRRGLDLARPRGDATDGKFSLRPSGAGTLDLATLRDPAVDAGRRVLQRGAQRLISWKLTGSVTSVGCAGRRELSRAARPARSRAGRARTGSAAPACGCAMTRPLPSTTIFTVIVAAEIGVRRRPGRRSLHAAGLARDRRLDLAVVERPRLARRCSCRSSACGGDVSSPRHSSARSAADQLDELRRLGLLATAELLQSSSSPPG